MNDDSMGRSNELIQHPGIPGFCQACFCPVYELAHGAPQYLVRDIGYTATQSLLSSISHIALTLSGHPLSIHKKFTFDWSGVRKTELFRIVVPIHLAKAFRT